MNKKLSLVVVTYNDGAHLEECLNALSFCDDKIIVDLGSKDDSLEIARKHGAKILHQKRVDIPGEVKGYASSVASNDWIVLADPDLIFPKGIEMAIKKEIQSSKNIGIIGCQYVNYFLGEKIEYGRWGGKHFYPAIINRKNVVFKSLVHQEIQLKDGYEKINLPAFEIKHYWVDSISQFYEKHTRYLKNEGESRYFIGARFSYFKMCLSLTKRFIKYYFVKLGFMDFKNGLRLLYLALWYEKNAWLSLKNYQENLNK